MRSVTPAFDQACRAYDSVLKEFPRKDHRHTIIHACLPTNYGLEICARHDIHIAAQSTFLDWPLEPLEYVESILGKRAFDILPLKTMVDMGIKISLGSEMRPAQSPIRSNSCIAHATTMSRNSRSTYKQP